MAPQTTPFLYDWNSSSIFPTITCIHQFRMHLIVQQNRNNPNVKREKKRLFCHIIWSLFLCYFGWVQWAGSSFTIHHIFHFISFELVHLFCPSYFHYYIIISRWRVCFFSLFSSDFCLLPSYVIKFFRCSPTHSSFFDRILEILLEKSSSKIIHIFRWTVHLIFDNIHFIHHFFFSFCHVHCPFTIFGFIIFRRRLYAQSEWVPRFHIWNVKSYQLKIINHII